MTFVAFSEANVVGLSMIVVSVCRSDIPLDSAWKHSVEVDKVVVSISEQSAWEEHIEMKD